MRANELIAERVRAGMTQRDAARVIDCSVNTYGRKETGKTAFTLDEAVKLCEAFNIDDPSRRAYIFLP